VSETVPAGWDLTSATCDDGSPIGAIDLAPEETVTCTFNNTIKRGNIVVVKQTDPDGSAQSFDFTASYSAGFALTDGQSNDSGPLLPTSEAGTYSVSETVLAGWDLTSATCDDGSPIGAIDLGPDETVTCTFTNIQRGKIIVEKQTDPDMAPGTFTFQGDVSGSIGDGGTLMSDLIPPGTYTATEDDPTPEFDLTAILCDDGNSTGDVGTRTATFNVEAGETVTCTFTNTQRGMVGVLKTVSGQAPTGDQAFTFQLRENASITEVGVTLETQVADALNGGDITFETKLVPGDTYQLCEIVMPGWMTNLGTFVPDSFMPPDGVAPNPNVDNSILCVDFTVDPGETKVFSVDNTPPPGGRALTIGFWKNWTSCDGAGNQDPELDRALAAAEPEGIDIGLLTLHGDESNPDVAPDCDPAVSLLDKRDIDSGKKKASDPAYNLAAQLLAAKLNLAAQAGFCGEVITAINAADMLLTDIGFDGTGDYKKGPNKMTAEEKALANELAGTLDDYNNNRLCN